MGKGRNRVKEKGKWAVDIMQRLGSWEQSFGGEKGSQCPVLRSITIIRSNPISSGCLETMKG